MSRIGVLRFRLDEAMAEIERLRASSFVTAVPSEEYERLLSENKLVREESDRHYQLWVDSKADLEKSDGAVWTLSVENARLKAEVEKIETEVASIGSEYMAATRHYNLLCNNLKAEVERLRKAGDEMHRAIKVSDPILDWKIELWNAAKEGKQS